MVTRIGTDEAKAACEAVVTRLDAGAGPGTIQIRTGTQPATGDTAASGTLLGTLTLTKPAFGAATSASPAVATAATITQATAVASGTAGWFRATDSAGNQVIDGSISASGGGGDMILSSTSIVSGGTISVTSWTVSMPTGA